MNLLNNQIYISELRESVNLVNPIKVALINKSVLITGATGIIGRELTDILMACNRQSNANIKIYAVGRDNTKTLNIFADYANDENFIIIDYAALADVKSKIDFVIHLASVTASKAFIDNPVEVIEHNFDITRLLLNFANTHSVEKFVYISSIEAYGNPYEWQNALKEGNTGMLDTAEIRNSYPIAKNVCEMLTMAYAKQYGINASVLRPSKVYGLTFQPTDKRMFIDFARKAINHENIVLHSHGKQRFSYIYCMDLAIAIIYALVNAKNQEIYNIANPNSISTVSKVAEIFAKINNVKVKYDILPAETSGYSKVIHGVLDTDKFISEIKYTPKIDLMHGIMRLLNCMECEVIC